MIRAAIATVTLMLVGGGAAAAPDPATLAKVDLIAETTAIAPATPTTLGVRFRMKPGWHVYWRNAGDSGTPPDITWRLPNGFAVDPPAWPAPDQINVGPLANYGYEGEVVLLVRVTPPANLPAGNQVTLAADVSFLACEHECVPGDAQIERTLDVVAAKAPLEADRTHADLFAAMRARLPKAAPWRVTHTADGDTITLTIVGLDPVTQRVASARFFPHADALIPHAADQRWSVTQDRATLVLQRSSTALTIPAAIDGVLKLRDSADSKSDRAYVVTSTVSAGAADTASQLGLLAALGLALLGGIILNLMPCVFPVLSIKLLQVAQHTDATPARLRLQGLAYTAGILVTFAALGGVLYALRAGGEEIGWGFQLQSPLVVAMLAYGLFAMALSLSGVVHVGHGLARLGNWVTPSNGATGAFASGLLAAIVATPCTAPFMGTALGYAMTQPPHVGLLVFLTLGLGLAIPFVVLAFLPSLRRRLPRPGAWMQTLQQALAFPLYASAAWLLWVLSQQVTAIGLAAALAGLIAIGFGAWTFALSQRITGRGRLASRLAALASVLILLPTLQTISSDTRADRSSAIATTADQSKPEAFSEARLDALLGEGRVVFVNMTAAWCITCLVNERVALSGETVRALLREPGIAYLKGDWTNRDPIIARVLERHGRNGVPLYLIHTPGREPVVLPQILTESIVVDALTRARASRPQATGG